MLSKFIFEEIFDGSAKSPRNLHVYLKPKKGFNNVDKICWLDRMQCDEFI